MYNSTPEAYHDLSLRCNAKQLFPNNSIVYQSSFLTTLTVQLKGELVVSQCFWLF